MAGVLNGQHSQRSCVLPRIEMLIGKLWFGRDTLQFGLELCLAKANRKAHPVTIETASACDVLLVSIFWYRDIYELVHFMRLAGIKRGDGKPYILVGGIQASLCPVLLAELVDGVFVGDGEDDLGSILDEIEKTGTTKNAHVYHSGDTDIPEPKNCVPTGFAIKSQGKKTGSLVRVEIARGCKFKCKFCALSHLKPYNEVPTEDILRLVAKIGKRKCSLFAPDRTGHSGWDEIALALTRNKCQDYGSDVRLENLSKVRGSMATFGLEGLSEKLRRSIGKRYSNKMVIERLGKFVEERKHIAFLTVYFILDLPGETSEDWDAARNLFQTISEAPWSRRLVIRAVANPLSPKMRTPLANARIHLFRDYPGQWEALRENGGKGWGFRMVKARTWDPLDRVMDAIIQRGGKAGAEVVEAAPSLLLSGWTHHTDRMHAARRLIATCEQHGISQSQLEGGE